MILLDTCALVFDALAPERLSAEALRAIEEGEENGSLACCDISLWEIAMLVAKGRLDPGTDALSFLKLVLASRVIRPLPITPEIARISANDALFAHQDTADRIIAATALHYGGSLVTCDQALQAVKDLKILW
ncbi:MAG: type II toxin-antitoxin system VapC family toxin [Proteobacteria bacterium]|nr:type II toxin-antitoxin system VapC family toxin [Pseudomonadota bacterium]MCG2739010.1 type II toxin-antitoxin system VapC family toxin [Syntrophaceae bacterium]